MGGAAQALPGQSVTEVTAWIQAHPTLDPASGETLLVRKTETPAQRFTFEASITAVGRLTAVDRRDIIRVESISLFDMVNGVSPSRLEESLEIIYGPDLYQDYLQSSVIYRYPSPELLNQAENRNAPLRRFVQGEVRQGAQFAYWVETVQTPSGIPQNGQISVFLLEDLPKLTDELEQRYQ
jgi:hypothetical protein